MIPEIDLYPRSLSRSRRRAGGVYYTPSALVTRVVTETLTPKLPAAVWRSDGSPILRILDPAAGTGRFLLECLAQLVDEAVSRGHASDSARKAIVRRCLVGIERDPEAAARCRAALGPHADIRTGEALLGGLVEDSAWDVVVGNPPYVRSVRLRGEDGALWKRLRGAFLATSFGEWDLYAAFMEQSLSWIHDDGVVGLVVPSRWLTARFAAPLRGRLAELGAVRRIVDFGAAQLFAGATTYTSLVFMSRTRSSLLEVAHERGNAGTIAASGLGTGPWILAVGAGAQRLEQLRAAGPALGTLARIAKGAGTNADPVFVVPAGVPMESEALVPCLRGRDVTCYGARPTRVLFPYREGQLIDAQKLRDRWPLASAYLERHRLVLERRERGRFSGARFHAWGRPQNLLWLRDRCPKIVVPDAAREGTLVLDTAYAIRPLDARVPIGLLLAVLNSPIVSLWLKATGIPLRGGYFRMKTAYLSTLPIPDPRTSAARAVAEAACMVLPDDALGQARLSDQVMAMYR